MMRTWTAAFILVIVAVYVDTTIVGLRVESLSLFWAAPKPGVWSAWEPPLESAISHTAEGDSIRYGALLFDETHCTLHSLHKLRLAVAVAMRKAEFNPMHRPWSDYRRSSPCTTSAQGM
jgi:hypothetical protein